MMFLVSLLVASPRLESRCHVWLKPRGRSRFLLLCLALAPCARVCGVVAMEARRARSSGGMPQGVPVPARSFDDGTSAGTAPVLALLPGVLRAPLFLLLLVVYVRGVRSLLAVLCLPARPLTTPLVSQNDSANLALPSGMCLQIWSLRRSSTSSVAPSLQRSTCLSTMRAESACFDFVRFV